MSLHKRQPAAAGEESTAAEDALSHDDLPFVASLQPSPLEVLVLEVARCFCHGWSTGELAAWDHAFELTEERFGLNDGAAFVARVISFMRALLRERRNGLRYMPLRCSRICKDEATLMRAVQSAIRGDADALRHAVSNLILTGHPEETHTLMAARALGIFCHQYDLISGPEGARPAHRTLN